MKPCQGPARLDRGWFSTFRCGAVSGRPFRKSNADFYRCLPVPALVMLEVMVGLAEPAHDEPFCVVIVVHFGDWVGTDLAWLADERSAGQGLGGCVPRSALHQNTGRRHVGFAMVPRVVAQAALAVGVTRKRFVGFAEGADFHLDVG